MDQNSKNILIHVKHLLKELKKPENVQLRKENKAELRIKMQEKFNQLQYCYPAIFGLVVESDPDEFEMNRLIEMLKLRTKVRTGTVEYDVANKYMGQKYFDEYIKPKID